MLQALQFEIAISRRCVNTMSTSTATKDMLQVNWLWTCVPLFTGSGCSTLAVKRFLWKNLA